MLLNLSPRCCYAFHLMLLLVCFCCLQIQYCYAQGASKKTAKSTVQTKANISPVAEQKEVKVPAGDPNKDNIAIYPFTCATGYDYEYAQSVGNAVESGFVRSLRFNVVERNRFAAIKQEERFKEVNTSEVVRQAAKLGAKYIITGHITGVNTGAVYSFYDRRLTGYQTTISLAFKIIDVETGLIKASESLNIVGNGDSSPLAKGNAYSSIDAITRRVIASYFPQRFKFMTIVAKEAKKKEEILKSFKIWGGSDHGIKVGDGIEIYQLSYVLNPANGKKVEEKTNIGYAIINAVNSETSATCEVYKSNKYGGGILRAMLANPELVVLEYTGGTKPRGFFDL